MEFLDNNYDFSKLTISDNVKVSPKKYNVTFPNEDFEEYPIDRKVRRAIGVLWSGGFDSTLLLLKHLNRGEVVLPIIFDFNNTESIFRHIIYGQLKNVFGDKLLYPYTFKIDHSKNGVYETNGRSQQIMIHFYLGLMQDDILRKIDHFEIGFIHNGVSLKNRKDYIKIYEGSINQQHNFIKKMTYPLSKKNKDEIFKEFDSLSKKYNLQLPCVSCYNPRVSCVSNTGGLVVDIISCEDCRSCERNINTAFPRKLNYHIEIPLK